MYIIGAGMAGLLAANMLRRHHPVVLESQLSLPHNHSALLRFRSTAVSDATGIPFAKVLVRKGIWDGSHVVNTCTIPLANIYAQKAMPGRVASRSVWSMEPEVRWIAPANFIEQMSKGVEVRLGVDSALRETGGMRVSTIPMPSLTAMFCPEYPLDFQSFGVYTAKAVIETPRCDLYQTLYNADTGIESGNWYRATIHGAEVTVESSVAQVTLDEIDQALAIFGLNGASYNAPSFHYSRFGKINSVAEGPRREFIVWATETQNIYSLGRFATWRPGLLLDDLVKDITIIERLITAGSYSRKLHTIKP